MSEEKAKAALKITIPVLIAVFSIFIAAQWISTSGYVNYCTETINRSRDTVLKLSASSTAASAAITALPGDLATPIATELAQLSKGFLVVLCALYLEKFMVTVSGAVAFKWLIPIACGLWLTGLLAKKEWFRLMAIKLCIAAAALLVVPASVKISNVVEDTYRESITQVIESAENSANQIQESVVDGSKKQEEAGNGLGKIVQSLKNSGDMIANGTAQMIEYFEKLLSRFIESLAIMLVTSCGIPLLVILIFGWLLKLLFHFDSYEKYKYLEEQIREQRRNHEK